MHILNENSPKMVTDRENVTIAIKNKVACQLSIIIIIIIIFVVIILLLLLLLLL